jgi:hypothetical protein
MVLMLALLMAGTIAAIALLMSGKVIILTLFRAK